MAIIGIIPDISDAINLIGGFLHIIPNYLKFILFLATVSLFVSMIAFTYNTFGWAHPRAFQSVDCLNAIDVTNKLKAPNLFGAWLSQYIIPNLRNPLDPNQQPLIKDFLLPYISDFVYNETNCFRIMTCIDAYSQIHNITCSCECEYGASLPLRASNLVCNPIPIYGLITVNIGNDCNEQIILQSELGNTTLTSYCKYLFLMNTTQQENLTSQIALAETCKTSGLDLLDARILWGATFFIAIIEFLFKFVTAIGLIKF